MQVVIKFRTKQNTEVVRVFKSDTLDSLQSYARNIAYGSNVDMLLSVDYDKEARDEYNAIVRAEEEVLQETLQHIAGTI